MHRTAASVLAWLAVVQGLLAQAQTIVSPLPASATVEGSQGNTFPLMSNLVCRYMQVHSDVGGSAKVIKKISFRRNGPSTATNGSRAVDLELRMGDSVPWDRISYVFANNFTSAPTVVLPRQIVTLGPISAPGNPAPFTEVAIPLQAPFVYSGVPSLAWDVVMFSNVVTGTTPPHDSESGTQVTGATSTLTGPGCIATGQTLTMDTEVQHIDRGGAYHFGLYVKYAPANAPTVMYFGTINPALSVPGLCGMLHTDLAAAVSLGNSDASGYLGERASTTTLDYPSALCTFVVPNTFGGATLYAQAHSLDLGSSSAIPVCNSNGRAWTVPFPNSSVVVRASRLYNFQLQGPLHPHATPLTLMHGYAAVTEFEY